ncbi:MAG: DNA polymerase III subunit beta [Ardenticatenia bacterium]|nr:DNA polymerase III subunit beta [Ardenticatenia bacterium]
MRVSCLQENLARGLSIVGRAVATRSTLPVLANVYIGTDGGRLKLMATNLEIGLSCWIGARVEEEGATTVPARTFDELVKQSPPEQIELEVDTRTETLRYRCGSLSANIKGIAASEFPIMPTAEETDGATVRVEADVVAEVVEQVVFAAATDETRPVLTGVLMEFEEDRMTLAAADGFRLSVRSARLGAPVEAPLRVIVPARAMAELGRIVKQLGGEVLIILTPNRNQVLFHMGEVDLVSQLIEGTFPDYRLIIPKGFETRVVVDRVRFLETVRRALIFARDAANIVRLEVDSTGAPAETHEQATRLIVRAEALETGSGKEVLPAAVEGAPLEIAFNGRYLMDVLGVVGSPQVALELTTPSSPGVFKPVGSEMEFVHVVMPMHLGGR